MKEETMKYIRNHCEEYMNENDRDYLNMLLDELDYLEDLSEYNYTKYSDLIHELADRLCDDYKDGLMKWLEEPDSDRYLKEVLEERMVDIKNYTLLNHIQIAQHCKHSRLFHTVLHYIEESIRALGFTFEY